MGAINSHFHNFSLFTDIPKFELEPVDIIVSLGQTAIFQCQVKPQQESSSLGSSLFEEEEDHYRIIWLRDDQPLTLDHRMKVLPSGMLEITDVKISDSGHYKCNVTLSDGSQQRLSRGAKLKLNFDDGEFSN